MTRHRRRRSFIEVCSVCGGGVLFVDSKDFITLCRPVMSVDSITLCRPVMSVLCNSQE